MAATLGTEGYAIAHWDSKTNSRSSKASGTDNGLSSILDCIAGDFPWFTGIELIEFASLRLGVCSSDTNLPVNSRESKFSACPDIKVLEQAIEIESQEK